MPTFARPLVAHVLLASLAVPLVGSLAPPARADAPATDPKAEARDRFDRGLRYFNDGDNASALAEFKRAHDLTGNTVVLFNLGLVYAAMGRPVDAADALDKVLSDTSGLKPEQVARAKQVKDDQTAHIARINVASSVAATIEVDNVDVGKAPTTAPIRLASGTHVVGLVAPGYVPQRKEITIAGGAAQDVAFELVAMEGKAAHVTVKSRLPGADVLIDGQVAGRTPLTQSLTVAPGKHEIALRRAGYGTARRDITLGDGASGEVTLEPDEDTSVIAAEGAVLALDLSETQAVVTVDGASRGPYAAPLKLARGPHRLLVERGDFLSVERDVTLDGGKTTTVKIVLEPTPTYRAHYASSESTQRAWGWVATVGGVALAGGGVGYLMWNKGQKSTAQDDFSTKTATLDAAKSPLGNCYDPSGALALHQAECEGLVSDVNLAAAKVDSVKKRDLYGYAIAGAGVGVTVVGIVLLATSHDPHKYDPKEAPTASGVRVMPVAWALPGGGFVGLGGAF